MGSALERNSWRVLSRDTVEPVRTEEDFKGFVFCPAPLQAGLSEQQIAWQQAIYARAYAEACRAVEYQFVESYVPLLKSQGPNWRN